MADVLLSEGEETQLRKWLTVKNRDVDAQLDINRISRAVHLENGGSAPDEEHPAVGLRPLKLPEERPLPAAVGLSFHPDGNDAGWNRHDSVDFKSSLGGATARAAPFSFGTTSVPGGRQQVDEPTASQKLFTDVTLKGKLDQPLSPTMEALKERILSATERLQLTVADVVNLFLPLRTRSRLIGESGSDIKEDDNGTIGGGEDGVIYMEEAVAVLEDDLGVLVSDIERESFVRQFRTVKAHDGQNGLRTCMVDAAQMLRCFFGFWEGSGLVSNAYGGSVSSRSSTVNCIRDGMNQDLSGAYRWQHNYRPFDGPIVSPGEAADEIPKVPTSTNTLTDQRRYADENVIPFGDSDRSGIVCQATANAIERYWRVVEPDILREWEVAALERAHHLSPQRRLRIEQTGTGQTSSQVVLPTDAFPRNDRVHKNSIPVPETGPKIETHHHWNVQALNLLRSTHTRQNDRVGECLTSEQTDQASARVSVAEVDYRTRIGGAWARRMQIAVMKDREWADLVGGQHERSAEVRLPRMDGLQSNFDVIACGGGCGGVVACHEGGFEAAVRQRGWEGLSRLEMLLNDHYCPNRGSRCFLSPLDLSHCLCQAGIEVDKESLGELVIGLGCDDAGRVDGTEVLHAIEDILLAEESNGFQDIPSDYAPDVTRGIPSEVEESPFGRSHAADPAKFLLPWLDDWVKPSPPTTDEVGKACQELEDQAALFRDLPSDPDERAQHFAQHFRDLDSWRGPLPVGHLPLQSFARALHDLGFDLSRREAAVVGFAFRVRGSSSDGNSKGGSSMHHHPDNFRVANPGRAPSLYDCVPGTRVFYRNIEGLEADHTPRVGTLHAVHKADTDNPSCVGMRKAVSRRVSGALTVGCGTADGLWYSGTIIRALQRGLALVRFDEGQMGGEGRGGERRVRRSCLRLSNDPDNQPRVEYVSFLRWLLSILPVDGGEKGVAYDDDLHFNGAFSSEDGFSVNNQKERHSNRTEGARGRNEESSKGWWITEEELAERLLAVMEAKGGMGFVGELRSRFRVADANQDGYLSKRELKTVLEHVGMTVSTGEIGRLMHALDANADGGVSYGEIVQFLLRHLGAWEQREAAVAAKVVRAMGTTPDQRRRWLAALRRRFFGLDRFQDGVLGGGQLIGVLRGLGVVLSDDEGMRLLDALEVEPWKQGGDDSGGGVRYSELLRFCARHAGPGESPVTIIAQRFRDALKRQIGPFFLQDVRRLFNAFDVDGDGLISSQEFSLVCDELLGPRQKMSADAKKRLLAAIDTDGFGKIAYPDFVRFVVEPSLHEPWFRNDTELAERFAGALRRQAAPGHLMEALQDAFDQADVGKSGRLDRDAVLRLLGNLQFRPSLRDHEVSRLVSLLDKDRDGLVSYKELLAFMLQHLDRRRDRLPEVLAAMRDQLRPLRKSRRGLLKRFADMCELLDGDRSGRVRPDELRKAADAVGLNVPLADAQVLSETLDTLGDGRIPWATIIDECGRDDTYFPSISACLPTANGNRENPQWRFLAAGREDGVVGIGNAGDDKPQEDRNFAMPANALVEEVRQALANAGVRLRGELLQSMRYHDVTRCGMLPEAHLFVAIADVAPELRLSKREKQALLRGVRQDQQGRFKYADFVELLLSA